MNNLDYNLVESLTMNTHLTSDLNNIFELDIDEVTNFFNKYFRLNDVLQMELLNSLHLMSNSKKIPLLKLIFMIICSSSVNYIEVLDNLKFLAKELTSIFFKTEENSTKIFKEIIKYILDEMYLFLPYTYFKHYMHNLIDNKSGKRHCYIKSAKLNLPKDVINVTDICIKHFASSTYLSG